MPTDPELGTASDDWDLAPCGLIELDERRRVVRANAWFLSRTGYSADDVAHGLAWSSLMTPAGRIMFETQLAPMLALNGTLDEVMLDLLCVDGRRMPVLADLVTVGHDDPTVPERTRVALMSVPDRQQYERRLRDAQRQAELASAANFQVRRRLELLAKANLALASSLDVEAALRGLAGVLAGELADWCLVYVVDPDHPKELLYWSAAHVDPARRPDVERLAPLLAAHASPESLLTQVLAGAGPLLLPAVTADQRRAATDSNEVLALYDSLDIASAVVVPSRARAQQAAVLVLIRGQDRPAFTEDDFVELIELADRTGIAIDNLRLYAQEHSASLALQKALLTPLPRLERLELASRYLPGANGSEVGGDWYDAFRQPDGTAVLVVGDVVGHDIKAAASMGQLRGVIRTIGHTTSGSPAKTLALADQAADGLQVRVMASAIVASIRETTPPGRPDIFTLQWSNAGHLPPLVVRRSGDVEILDRPADLLLGVFPERDRRQFAIDLRPGDTLLLYTDGLVERRDEDVEDSVAGLARSLTGAAGIGLEELCDRALQRRPTMNNDDAALLAVRIRNEGVRADAR
jgi:GAF domain-containing protein